MKIGIELNNIIRDINTQIIKYYKKDINKEYDDTNLDKKSSNLILLLPFKSNKERNNFMYIDYPYEIFGCAKTLNRNLINSVNNFEIKLNNLDDGNSYHLVHFSLLEAALTIQSTYYFLSKVGSRVREVIFPKRGSDIWKSCDVVITTNKRIIKTKPNNKIAVLIRTSDNSDVEKYADLVYDDLLSLMDDEDFIKYINKKPLGEENGFFNKIKNKFLKYFKHGD